MACDAVALEEHVLGAAEPDALGAEVAAATRVVRRVGVGAHPEVAHLVGPPMQPLRSRRHSLRRATSVGLSRA